MHSSYEQHLTHLHTITITLVEQRHHLAGRLFKEKKNKKREKSDFKSNSLWKTQKYAAKNIFSGYILIWGHLLYPREKLKSQTANKNSQRAGDVINIKSIRNSEVSIRSHICSFHIQSLETYPGIDPFKSQSLFF